MGSFLNRCEGSDILQPESAIRVNWVKTNRCPVCRSQNGYRRLYALEKYGVFRCNCAAEFIDPSIDGQSQIEIYRDQETLKAINAYCGTYYDYDTLRPGCVTQQQYERALSKLESLTEGRNMLEVGCGIGTFLEHATRMGWNGIGVDSSAESVKALVESGVAGVCADFLKYSAESPVDVIVLWDLLEHPQDPGAFVRKAWELLKPGGLFLIASPNYPNLLSLLAGCLYRLSGGIIKGPLEKLYAMEHTSYLNKTAIANLMEQHGFVTAKVWKEETDLARYTFSPFMRICLALGFSVARLIGLPNRISFIARKRHSV